MIKYISIILIIIAAFIIWRWTSVGRGARKRDEILLSRLDPVGKRIDEGEDVAVEEIEEIAKSPEIRHILFGTFRHMEREDLLPKKFLSSIDQGASSLAYWMMHPNELGDAPDKIEFIETVERQVNGKAQPFHVYRFKMKRDSQSEELDWEIGLAGPMDDSKKPYEEIPGAFSRGGDIEGKCKPEELVDWYVDMLKKKGLVT